MAAQIVVSQALIVTAHLEVSDEQLLDWLKTERNIFKYLDRYLRDCDRNIKITSLTQRDEIDFHSIEKSDGSKWKWDGEYLNEA